MEWRFCDSASCPYLVTVDQFHPGSFAEARLIISRQPTRLGRTKELPPHDGDQPVSVRARNEWGRKGGDPHLPVTPLQGRGPLRILAQDLTRPWFTTGYLSVPSLKSGHLQTPMRVGKTSPLAPF